MAESIVVATLKMRKFIIDVIRFMNDAPERPDCEYNRLEFIRDFTIAGIVLTYRRSKKLGNRTWYLETSSWCVKLHDGDLLLVSGTQEGLDRDMIYISMAMPSLMES